MRVKDKHRRAGSALGVSQSRIDLSVGRRKRGSTGFTFVEILVVLGLLMLLVIAAVGAITLLERSSRRQADHTTALEYAQGRLDAMLSREYNPPLAPFTSSNWEENDLVTLTVMKDGTSSRTMASVMTLTEPVLNGHVATVVVSYTNQNQPVQVRLQTLINKLSGGQP